MNKLLKLDVSWNLVRWRLSKTPSIDQSYSDAWMLANFPTNLKFLDASHNRLHQWQSGCDHTCCEFSASQKAYPQLSYLDLSFNSLCGRANIAEITTSIDLSHNGLSGCPYGEATVPQDAQPFLVRLDRQIVKSPSLKECTARSLLQGVFLNELSLRSLLKLVI